MTDQARELEGRVAVITGATSGMGKAMALRFAAAGAAVVLVGRNRDRGAEVCEAIRTQGGRAEFVAGDVAEEATNRRAVETACDAFGGLHILVANAGGLFLGSVTGLSPAEWHEALGTNLTAAYYLLHHGLPRIQEQGGGAVVLNASIAAFKGFPNHAAYCASKGGLVALGRQVAADYAPAIRVNVICPGPVDTPLIWDSARAFPNPAEAVTAAGRRTPMRRLGTPEEVAELALFLASERSSWITGGIFVIDGGATVV
ncbi:MAG: SDR family NAD(P)-dependent oxidoreductase [Acidobacteriota bacterium]